MSADWCDLCELPLSQCPHGAPPPPPPAPAPRAAPRVRRSTARVPGTPAPSAAAPAPRPAVRRTPPGRTPQTEFRRALLTVLADQPVAVERDEVLGEIETLMTLTDQDRGITADGEVRWRRTALKERKAMADDGLMATAGHGMWALSPRGREEAALVAEASASQSETESQTETD